MTISPGTRFYAWIFYYSPFLITNVSGGIKFLNASIIASDLAFYKNVITPVKRLTITITIPKYN